MDQSQFFDGSWPGFYLAVGCPLAGSAEPVSDGLEAAGRFRMPGADFMRGEIGAPV